MIGHGELHICIPDLVYPALLPFLICYQTGVFKKKPFSSCIILFSSIIFRWSGVFISFPASAAVQAQTFGKYISKIISFSRSKTIVLISVMNCYGLFFFLNITVVHFEADFIAQNERNFRLFQKVPFSSKLIDNWTN